MKPHRVIKALVVTLVVIFAAAVGLAEEAEPAKTQAKSQVQNKEQKKAKSQVQNRTSVQTRHRTQEKLATQNQSQKRQRAREMTREQEMLQKRQKIQEKTATQEQPQEQAQVREKTASQQKLKTQNRTREQAFVDRDGDGVCDSYQTQARNRKEIKKRHRKNLAGCNGCGTGGQNQVMHRGSGRDSGTAVTHRNGNTGTTKGGTQKGGSKGKQGK